MKKVLLPVSKIGALILISKARGSVTAMTAASGTFAHPIPALTEITTAANDLELAYDAFKHGGPYESYVYKQKLALLRSKMRQLSSYVNSIANGDGATITLAGFEVSRTPSPTPVPSVVTGLTIASNGIGSLDLKWSKTPHAEYYEVYMGTTSDISTFTFANSSTTRKMNVADLTSGQQYWFYVIAVNSNGESAPSAFVKAYAN